MSLQRPLLEINGTPRGDNHEPYPAAVRTPTATEIRAPQSD